jgi:heme-degrading monooxygenase HmoA
MFARVVTIQGSPDRIDEVTRYARERVLPTMRGLAGFKSMQMLIDRKAGRALGISLWESEEALGAARATLEQLRAGAVDRGATAEPAVAEYEVTVQE